MQEFLFVIIANNTTTTTKVDIVTKVVMLSAPAVFVPISVVATILPVLSLIVTTPDLPLYKTVRLITFAAA